MQTSKGCAFLMDMGTGKTITTIAVAGAMYQEEKIKKLLVVCPKSIVDVWEQEFEKFAGFPYSVVVLDGTGLKKIDTIRHMNGIGLQVIVVNYESCWRLEAELTKWKPDIIVCDESSKIKNPQAKCSKALHRLGKITVSVVVKDIDEARSYFNRVGADLSSHLSQLSSSCEELDSVERFRIFHDFFRAGEEVSFSMDLKKMIRQGRSFRDYICPDTSILIPKP